MMRCNVTRCPHSPELVQSHRAPCPLLPPHPIVGLAVRSTTPSLRGPLGPWSQCGITRGMPGLDGLMDLTQRDTVGVRALEQKGSDQLRGT